MYHLFVSGNEEAWNGDPWTIDISRCLSAKEYTEDSLAVDFEALDSAARLQLGQFPCIFAYETGTGKDARLGKITKIRRNGAKIQILYELDEDYPPIEHEHLVELQWDLGIWDHELYRSHWALKDEDPFDALKTIGYPCLGSHVLVNVHYHAFYIALSFPGEVRPYVESTACALVAKLGKNRVFYDNDYKAQLARPNLDTALQSLYTRARLIVAFLSRDYASKSWCHIEFRAIREIISAREDARVMFIRHDDAEVKGVFSTDGYIDAERHEPVEVAEMIVERLRLLS